MNKQVLKLLLLIVLSFQGLFNATAQYSGGAFLYAPSGTLARFTPSVSGDNIGCDSVILMASGGASYYWSGGGNHSSVSYTALSSGTYTVTVVNPGGCTASLSKSVTVIKPTATISGSTMGCDSVVLTASGGIDYLWNSDAGTNPAVNRVLMSGIYKVTVTDEYGCTASASTTVQIEKRPILTGLSPINGNTGTLAVINGSNLNGVTGITFNGVAASGFSIINDNEIHATLPVSGQVQILGATSLCGTASLDILPPVVTGFQPSSGPPGTLVTIAGSNLYNLNNVTVGGTQALVIKSTPGSVVAYIMPGTQSGTIAVTTGL